MTTPTDTAETAFDFPRRGLVWAAVTYALATLSLAWPALTGQFLVNPRSDQFMAGYAFREFAAASLRDGAGFPLWNPYLFGGMPYVAAMHGDIFYPTAFLRMMLPTDVAMTWGFIIHVFLAGLFTYVLLRALGLGFFGALIGGLAYMMSGNVAGLVSPGHDGKLFISALLPLALLFVVRGIRDGRPWAWGGLAVTVGLGVLSPHPQLLQYLLLVSGAMGFLLAFANQGVGKPPRAVAIRRLGASAVAVILGGAMGAIQYLPVREYVPWSPRAGGKPWELATSFSMPPEEMLNFWVPEFSGILDRYWGDNGIHLHSEYVGVAVLLLAALAFARGRRAEHRALLWFFGTVTVVATLWALGGYTPFYRLVYAIVPGTKFFRAPSTMLFVVTFGLAVLAGFGADRAARRAIGRRYLIVWAAMVAAIGAIGALGGLSNLAVSLATDQRQMDLALLNDAAMRAGALRSTVFGALALACLFLLSTGRLAREAGGYLLAGIVAADLWSVERAYWQFSPPAAEIFASDETIEYVKRQPDPGRVLQFATGNVGRDPFLLYDGLMPHGVRTVLGYHGNELGRFQLLGGEAERWRHIGNPNFWHLLNVRYVLTDAEDLGVPALTRVVGPVRNAFGTTVYLFEMTDEYPAAWVVPAIVKAPDDDVLATILDPRFDVRRAALFDTSAAVTAVQLSALPEPLSLNARVTRLEPGAIDVELDQPAPPGSALVVSENFYPGWSAEVDGAPATIGRTDMTLIGVELPAGARAATLRFSSAPYETGKRVTLVALVLAIVWWGGGLLMGMRRRD
ncbi:MAG TPA: hypothetical protein VF981_06840 [Gemmatimonadaceae bacterium]